MKMITLAFVLSLGVNTEVSAEWSAFKCGFSCSEPACTKNKAFAAQCRDNCKFEQVKKCLKGAGLSPVNVVPKDPTQPATRVENEQWGMLKCQAGCTEVDCFNSPDLAKKCMANCSALFIPNCTKGYNTAKAGGKLGQTSWNANKCFTACSAPLCAKSRSLTALCAANCPSNKVEQCLLAYNKTLSKNNPPVVTPQIPAVQEDPVADDVDTQDTATAANVAPPETVVTTTTTSRPRITTTRPRQIIQEPSQAQDEETVVTTTRTTRPRKVTAQVVPEQDVAEPDAAIADDAETRPRITTTRPKQIIQEPAQGQGIAEPDAATNDDAETATVPEAQTTAETDASVDSDQLPEASPSDQKIKYKWGMAHCRAFCTSSKCKDPKYGPNCIANCDPKYVTNCTAAAGSANEEPETAMPAKPNNPKYLWGLAKCKLGCTAPKCIKDPAYAAQCQANCDPKQVPKCLATIGQNNAATTQDVAAEKSADTDSATPIPAGKITNEPGVKKPPSFADIAKKVVKSDKTQDPKQADSATQSKSAEVPNQAEDDKKSPAVIPPPPPPMPKDWVAKKAAVAEPSKATEAVKKAEGSSSSSVPSAESKTASVPSSTSKGAPANLLEQIQAGKKLKSTKTDTKATTEASTDSKVASPPPPPPMPKTAVPAKDSKGNVANPSLLDQFRADKKLKSTTTDVKASTVASAKTQGSSTSTPEVSDGKVPVMVGTNNNAAQPTLSEQIQAGKKLKSANINAPAKPLTNSKVVIPPPPPLPKAATVKKTLPTVNGVSAAKNTNNVRAATTPPPPPPPPAAKKKLTLKEQVALAKAKKAASTTSSSSSKK